MKYYRTFPIIALFSSILLLNGCVATTKEFVDLKDEIYQLQLKLNEVQRNQADLSSKMDSLMTNMDALSSALSVTGNNMSLLSQHLDDIESSLMRKISRYTQAPLQPQNIEVSSQAPVNVVNTDESDSGGVPPSKIYQLAYTDFAAGKYDIAIDGFRSYIQNYPKGELADQAQYYIGECHFAKSEWDNAIAAFDALEKNYKDSKMLPSGYLKKALCFEQKGSLKDARSLFEKITKDFPGTSEAFTAQDKLGASRKNGK